MKLHYLAGRDLQVSLQYNKNHISFYLINFVNIFYKFFYKLSVSITTDNFCSIQHCVCLHLSQKLQYTLFINKAMVFFIRCFCRSNFPRVFSQVAPSQMCNFPSGSFTPPPNYLGTPRLLQLRRSAP